MRAASSSGISPPAGVRNSSDSTFDVGDLGILLELLGQLGGCLVEDAHVLVAQLDVDGLAGAGTDRCAEGQLLGSRDPADPVPPRIEELSTVEAALTGLDQEDLYVGQMAAG